MAKEPVTIPKEPEIPESKDYRFLKREGIDLVQLLAGDIWTDYNEHDPGVTILEQLCFSLTELAYKAGMSIEDILYAQRDVKFDSKDNAFFNPDKIFPCSPLTPMDYRRLLIDHLYPNVKNAWLVPLESGAFGVNLSGLYQVNLILNKYSLRNEEKAREATKKLLNQFRNLSEDFETIRVLKPLTVSVKASIDINSKALGEAVLAKALYAMAVNIMPPVRFNSREELEERGMSVEEIFEGPVPKHGFVDVDSLKASGVAPAWTVAAPTTLVNLLREVEGVERVSQVDVGVYIKDHRLPEGYNLIEKLKGDEEHDGWYISTRNIKLPRGHRIKKVRRKADLLPDLYELREQEDIPDGFFPKLDIESILEQGLIQITIEGLPYECDLDTVQKYLERIQAEHLTQYQHPVNYPDHDPKSGRKASEIAYYFSLQNSFPEVYGIGRYGVSKNRPLEWRNHSRHLKSYLFFFEQVLADYLAQLTNFYKLFTLKEDVKNTYFHQLPRVPNQELVTGENRDEEKLEEQIQEISNQFDPVADRRNRALDHLLSRFGEEFLSEAYNSLTRNSIEENQEKFEHALIRAKIRFLNEVVELGRDRGKGLNHLAFEGGKAPTDAVNHSSALQKRLALLFNLKDHQHVSLTEGLRDADGVGFSKKGKVDGGQGKEAFTFSQKDADILRLVLKEGLSRENFVIHEDSKNEGQFLVFFQALSGKSAKSPVYKAENRDKCEVAITALIKRLRELNATSEGFHLLEHVLLRPVGTTMNTWFLVHEGRVYLETPVMENTNFESDFKLALLERGQDAENYITTGSNEDGYTLVLTAEDGSIIGYKEGYLDETSAERERNRIINILPMMDDPDSGVEIQMEKHIPKGALLADDFYSLQISVVLPSWPVRFMNDKFRALFEQVVKLNVPAHTKVNCYWLDFAELADFEKVFIEWRNEKAKLKPNQPWLDELSWCLVVMLKYFADPNDELVVKDMPALRDKHGLTMKFRNES